MEHICQLSCRRRKWGVGLLRWGWWHVRLWRRRRVENGSKAVEEEKEERIVGPLSFAVRLAFVMNSGCYAILKVLHEYSAVFVSVWQNIIWDLHWRKERNAREPRGESIFHICLGASDCRSLKRFFVLLFKAQGSFQINTYHLLSRSKFCLLQSFL